MAAKSSTARRSANPFVTALAAEASEAGLRYTNDEHPGITRRQQGKAFTFLDPDGRRVSDQATLLRIRNLAIPPAWSDVWISPSENGHIQATGRDARGRKQYRYHPQWREQRDDNKFGRMLAFARALPRIRQRVQRDLRRRGMPREKVLATVVRLLESTLIRVGNDEYAQHNHSYGLTTLHNQHVQVAGARLRFSFRGKSGRRHDIRVEDPQLARIVRRCQDLPGQELFAYQSEDGETRDVTSQDVNDYLRETTGADFTAKDFRTWAGTVLAAIALREFQQVIHSRQAKKNVEAAIEAVARMLGNTPTVCRKCYVHPEILESYLAGDTIATITQRMDDKVDRSLSRLKPEEAAVIVLLQRRLQGKSRARAANGSGSRGGLAPVSKRESPRSR